MNEVTLPPSPNWYLSTILKCTEDGTVAWGSKNHLIIGKRPSNVEKSLDYIIIPNIHTEKINSLSFCPNYGKDKNYIVTSGNDHTLKVWNTETLKMISSKCYIDSEEKIIGVDWSKCDENLICCISTRGILLTWQFSFNTHQIIPLGKITATCISCSIHKQNIVAIGTKSGLIYIVNIQNSGTINYKLRGHDYEITSLSWCPTSINILNNNYQKDYLLASGGKDRKIFIWKADGRAEAQINLPITPLDNNQHRNKLNSNNGTFTSILWIEPNILIVSSIFGELLSLKLSSIKNKQKPSWKFIHGCHSRGIFSISSFIKPILSEDIPKINDDENWRTEKEEMISENCKIWSIGQERQVVCVSPGDDDDWKINYNIPTLAGYVYCISPCPLDTSRISFGVGDGLLRIWNLSEPHETTFDITCVWQKIMGRITAISWHPEKENLLAYGTSEGRIGIYDTCNYSKLPILFKQYHRKTIYRLNWGPNPSNNKNNSTWSLYCCADGELTRFNYDKPQDKPQIIIEKNCSEFSWKPDFSCIAIGYTDGSITFLNKNLENFGKTIFQLKKNIEYLLWHPDSTATDWNYSPYKNYLAASSTTSTITIFDMSKLIQNINNDENQANSQNFYNVVANLTGHSERIFCMDWSPHISGYLASGSADNVVQIWQISEQQIIASYTGHCSGVQSVMWSPLDPDLIISGSADNSLRIWRISDQKIIMPNPEIIVTKTKSKKLKKKSSINNENQDKNDNQQLEIHKNEETIEKEIPQSKEKKIKGKRTVSYLPNYRKKLNDKENVLKLCLNLAKQVKTGESSETIFGSNEEISKILNIELETHWNQGQSMMSAEVSIWNNKLKETLLKAIESQSLSDFMVSLAPTLSMKFWQEICEAYANQLINEGNPTKAVSYLLIIHKIHKAIDLLMQTKMYREAYIIARCKLESDDPIIKELIEQWLSSSIQCGSFEDAAQCAIINNEFSNAAKILSRRKDILTLEIAAELANFDENKELCNSIVEQALDAALSEFNYEKSWELLKKFSNINCRCIQIEAHENIKNKIEKFESSSILSWLKGESSYGLIEELKKKYEEMKNNFLNFELFHDELSHVIYPPLLALNQTKSNLWLVISREIALSATASNYEESIRHIVSALGGISQYELMNPIRSDDANDTILIRIITILDAKSPSDEKSIFYFKDKEKIQGIYKSLRVYLCVGLLNWLVEKITKFNNEEISINFVVEFIENSIEFILDEETVKYWMTTAEITKLENSLISSKKNDDDHGDSHQNDTKNQIELMKRLEEARQAQKKFIDERLSVPSPMLVYSKAMELCNLIEDEEIKSNFTKIVGNAWKKATDFPTEN